MKYQSILNKLFTILGVTLLLSVPGTGLANQIESPEAAFPTVITYQGYLESDGQPVNNLCKIKFTLWDDPSAGGPVGPELQDTYEVTDGRFTAELDFGNVFDGRVLWLQIAVQCEGDADFTGLPRQALRSTPYSMDADKLDNKHANEFATAAHAHDHGALSGLGDDDHPQYFGLGHAETLTGNNTFSGLNTFSGSSYPFLVNSSWLIPNLNADLLDGQHAASFQTRVSGACAQGSTIRSINADGTVVCEPHETRPVFSTGTLWPEDYAPSANAITIGSDGLPVMAFNNLEYLYVTHCNDLACTTASTNLVEYTEGAYSYPAIAIAANGFPIISYYYWGPSGAAKDLRVARCNDLACSSATFNTVGGGYLHDVGTYSSIVIDIFGNPVISYLNVTDSALEFVQCSDPLCNSWSSSPLDVGSVSGDTSITISGDGAPLISYKKSNNLTTWHCAISGIGSSYDCLNGYTKTTIDASDVNGLYNSITTGNDGFGVISYYSSTAGDLRVAHCDNFLCSTFTIHTLDTIDTTGFYNAISIGSDGFPVISYNYTSGTTLKYLRVAHCSDPVCHAWTLANVDTTTGTKGETAIAIGMDGMPVIVYQNESDLTLKFAHCSNVFCMGWFRRK